MFSLSKKKPTNFIHCIDVGMTGDEFLYHSLHSQPCGQNQCGGAIVHTGVEIRGPVSDQNLGGEIITSDIDDRTMSSSQFS